MRPLSASILFFIISVASHGEAYRILGIFPFNGKSHFVMFGQLMKGLAERGHQVDVVSHFPLKKPFPNYTDVASLAGILPSFVNNMTFNWIRSMDGTAAPYVIGTMFGADLCDLMKFPGLRDLIINPPKNPPYDLVITEIFGATCYLAMGQHLKVPVVGLVSASMLPWANDFVANPDNPSFIPNLFSFDDASINSFWKRVKNTLANFKIKRQFNQGSERQTDAIKNHIGPHAPTVWEAERNVSLILVNSHYSLNGVRPFTTAVVEVGGLHIDEREATLPNDLQKWLDDSEDGFVYVSFGSMIKLESLPEKTLVAIYASLKKLAPTRVLMKIAEPEELPPGLPNNVLTGPWIPQLAVLKHKNTRAFVTHGGLMGTQEAVYCGVPMIGIPVFGDQTQNVDKYSRLNLAVALDYNDITEEKLDAAFQAVLRDPSYMKAAKRISALFRDRPMSAMDTAVYWIEYVIRHGGTTLRSPAMDLTWWQIDLLDVYGFLLLSIVLAVWFMVFMARKLRELFHPSSASSLRESKKVK